MRINNLENQQNFKGLNALARPLGVFYNPNATLPTLLIETGVTAGRAWEANKTSGKIEATERLVEQGLSAVIWLWGVQTLKNIGEKIGQKAFKLNNLNFDVGFDYLRNPLENIDKKLISFKARNILLSTALATAFIGFCLPKINHFITNKMLKKQKKGNRKLILKPIGVEEYKKSLKKTKDISFTSLFDKSLNLAHILENESVPRLLITDAGVVGGRFYNARNKYEKIENLFRDVSSIYFYLFSTKHIVKLLNKISGNADIDPKVLNETVKMLSEKANSQNIDSKNLLSKAIGTISKANQEKIDELFKDKKVVSLEDFLSIFSKQSKKAKKISELQPLLGGKSVITKKEAKDILSRGWASNADFLHKIYNAATNGKYNKKEKFVSAKNLDKTRESVDNFIKQLSKTLKKQGGELTEDLIKKTAQKNIFKNFAYYSIATIASTFALAILIPKVQYFIRRKLTNDNEFVGIKEYK